MRSSATRWAKDSVLAVDAGIHLAAIIRIFEEHLPNATSRGDLQSADQLRAKTSAASLRNDIDSLISPSTSLWPPGSRVSSMPEPITGEFSSLSPTEPGNPTRVLASGPFANLEFPHDSAKANGAYVLRNLISTYLITHPHLDHISGFAVNTASLKSTSHPKRLAALPTAVDAIKTHIFNNVIWPNLSDEDGGVGLVTFLRLTDSGNPTLKDANKSDYVELCEGLSVSCWSVSHGQHKTRHVPNGSSEGANKPEGLKPSSRRALRTTSSIEAEHSHRLDHIHHGAEMCVYDSTAFFIRDHHTSKEVLIFGDVEPDSISLSPRTARVWSEAAPKILLGTLTGILIECSYDDSQRDEMLYGHLCPRHLIVELQVLGEMVTSLKRKNNPVPKRKRKRADIGAKIRGDPESCEHDPKRPLRNVIRAGGGSITRAIMQPPSVADSKTKASGFDEDSTDTQDQSLPTQQGHAQPPNPLDVTRPLEGLQIVIIHIKDTLEDGPEIGDTILAQLQELETTAQLGCVFAISKPGTSIWL